MLPLGSLFREHNVSFHCYADDTQINLPLNLWESNSITYVLNCLQDVKYWMTKNCLQLNNNQTEVVP